MSAAEAALLIGSFVPGLGEAIDAYDCLSGDAWGCGGLAFSFVSGRLARRITDSDAVRRVCSFSAETEVLLGDGSAKKIADIEIGDYVLAENPETGERANRRVEALWVHQDLIFGLGIDGELVRTTADHPFWNESESTWQATGELRAGDFVRSADGAALAVGRFDWLTPSPGSAYNLTASDINTFFVGVGDDFVLVHNLCPNRTLRRNLGAAPFEGAQAHHIVPHGHSRKSAKNARAVLARLGLDINSADNGVYLAPGAHQATCTHEYIDYVGDLVVNAERSGGRQGVITALNDLAAELAATNDWARVGNGK